MIRTVVQGEDNDGFEPNWKLQGVTREEGREVSQVKGMHRQFFKYQYKRVLCSWTLNHYKFNIEKNTKL